MQVQGFQGLILDYPDSFTKAEIAAAEAIVSAWPVAWFKVRTNWSLDEKDSNELSDLFCFLELERLDGPILAEFISVSKVEGRYQLTFVWNDGDGPDEQAPVETLEEALQPFLDYVLGEVSRWGLLVRRRRTAPKRQAALAA